MCILKPRVGLLIVLAALGVAVGSLRSPLRADETPKSPTDQTLVIEVNGRGELVHAGHDPLVKVEDVRKYLADEYARLKQVAETKKARFDPELSIRSDKEARFQQIHAIMAEATKIGFKVRVRATSDTKAGPKD